MMVVVRVSGGCRERHGEGGETHLAELKLALLQLLKGLREHYEELGVGQEGNAKINSSAPGQVVGPRLGDTSNVAKVDDEIDVGI